MVSSASEFSDMICSDPAWLVISHPSARGVTWRRKPKQWDSSSVTVDSKLVFIFVFDFFFPMESQLQSLFLYFKEQIIETSEPGNQSQETHTVKDSS